MSFLDKIEIIDETFSLAGKASAEKYNLLNQANKIQEKEKKRIYKDFLFKDSILKDKKIYEGENKIYSFEDLHKAQTPKQRAKIKKDIKKIF